jgi:hypothetical protein
MRARLTALCLLLALSLPAARAQQGDARAGAASENSTNAESGTTAVEARRTEAYTDFEEAQFHIVVRRPVEDNLRNMPAATTQIAASIEDGLAGIFSDAIVNLRVDSLTTARERFTERSELLSRLPELSRQYSRRTIRRGPDLSWVEVHYRYELYPTLARLFVTHDRARPMPSLLRWEPSGPYTGIVIFAKEPLPVRGEGREAELQPAMLPEVYTTDLEPLLTPEMQEGDLVRSRGVLGYTSDVSGGSIVARAGQNPMYLMAHELFGEHDTDIILHPHDAERILASDSARSVLEQGRVVVIVADDQIRTD